MNSAALSMEMGGVSFQTLPLSEVESVLTYSELSDYLDLLCWDILHVSPNIFLSTNITTITPGELKCYLYCLCMYYFHCAGVLSPAAYTVPDTSGSLIPSPLLAYLSYIGSYQEGSTIGKARYDLPVSAAVIGNSNLANGTASEANLYLSALTPSLCTYAFDATYNEYYMAAQVADARTILTAWASISVKVGNILREHNYPCLPFPVQILPPPDGSFYSFPSMGLADSTAITVAGNFPYFQLPFNKSFVEVAQLYYTPYLTNWPTPNGVPVDLKPGLMPSLYPVAGAGTVVYDAYDTLKMSFIFINRNNSYQYGLSTLEIRNYHGDKLKSFLPRGVQISMEGFHSAVAMTVECLTDMLNTGTNVTSIFSLLLIADICALRRIQKLSFGYYVRDVASSLSYQRYAMSNDADVALLPTPLVQLVNDLGPVVCQGVLHVPVHPKMIAWTSNFPAFSSKTSAIIGGFDFGLYYSNTAVLSFPIDYQGVTATINDAWVTGYNGAHASAVRCATPFYSLGQWIRTMAEFCMSTSLSASYGRSDILYPYSKSPRGSVAMLAKVRSLVSTPNIQLDSAISSNFEIVYFPVAALYSNYPLSGPESILALVARWCIDTDVNAVNLSSVVTKYCLRLDYQTDVSLWERYISGCLDPGGPFLDRLSKAQAMRHGSSETDYGLVSHDDTGDACIWDAVKGLLAPMAQAVLPTIARVACSSIPVVGGLLGGACSSATAELTNYALSTAKVSTNRKPQRSVNSESRVIRREVRKIAVSNFNNRDTDSLPDERSTYIDNGYPMKRVRYPKPIPFPDRRRRAIVPINTRVKSKVRAVVPILPRKPTRPRRNISPPGSSPRFKPTFPGHGGRGKGRPRVVTKRGAY